MADKIKVKIGEGGRFVVPASLRHALNLKIGDEIVLTREGDRIVVSPLEQVLDEAVAHIREIAKRKIPKDADLLGELTAMRKRDLKKSRDKHDF